MPATTCTLPNVHLRRERERRGWSREYVAERIGVADPKTIGRWERGVAAPSAYFRQQLCNFFGLPARDLGLWREDEDEIAQAALEVAPPVRKGASFPRISLLYDPLIPPAHTAGLVGRDELLRGLKVRLCVEKGQRLAALAGLPGAGKTALAVEFVHDADVQRHFREGMLWASLGAQPDAPGLLRRWGALLGIAQKGAHQERCNQDLTGAIRAAIGERRMLLVIDGAGEGAEALALQVSGPNCACLLTTRSSALALAFAGAGAMLVRELGLEDSLRLLTRFAPNVALNEPEMARALAQAVGGLPLALTLVGRYLQAHQGISDAIAR